MFFKRVFFKIWYLIKQNKFWILSTIIWSVLLFLYLIFYVQVFANEHGFNNEGVEPEEGYVLPFFILTFPVVFSHLIYAIKVIQKLTFLRILIYPILLITLLYSLYFFVRVYGGQTIWLFIYLFFPILFLFVIIEIIALVLDIKTYKNTKIEDAEIIDYFYLLLHNSSMFFKNLLHKIRYLIKQNKFWILSSVITSGLVYLYLTMAIPVYGVKHDFYSANTIPIKKHQLFYCTLLFPCIIPYLIFVIKILKNLKFLRILIYPILVLTIYLCLAFIASSFGYYYFMRFLNWTYYLLIISLVIVEITAYLLDINSYQKTKIEES